ncbi:MAG: 2-amino-4-hydroxy-6-hydroxymethyldihydropteridine diphosphokinase [Gemmatimonadaceae bacterium]
MREAAYIALGSNLGDRAALLQRARQAIAGLPESSIIAVSRVDETEPLGMLDQPRYLNQIVKIETALAPRDLLERLHGIERSLGRVRAERWGSRTIDLDLVLYADVASDDPALRLPHPGLATRAFWQRGIAQVDARRDAGGAEPG